MVEAGDVVDVEEVVVDVHVVVDVVEDVVEVVVDVDVDVVVELASQNHKGHMNDGIFSSWKKELKAKAYYIGKVLLTGQVMGSEHKQDGG